jgi:hypothetical protein
MVRKKQEKEKLLTPQAAYAEAARYLENAKEALQKAGKEDRFYCDRKYVHTACGIAHLGVLIACDGFLAMRGVQLPKKRTIDFYREHVAKLDGKLLDDLNSAYNILHLFGYYEGELSVAVVKAGFDIGGVNKLSTQIWSNNIVPFAVKIVSFYIYFFKLLIANFYSCFIHCII